MLSLPLGSDSGIEVVSEAIFGCSGVDSTLWVRKRRVGVEFVHSGRISNKSIIQLMSGLNGVDAPLWVRKRRVGFELLHFVR